MNVIPYKICWDRSCLNICIGCIGNGGNGGNSVSCPGGVGGKRITTLQTNKLVIIITQRTGTIKYGEMQACAIHLLL